MEEEWERANRSTQTRMGWGTKYGVQGRKHSGGEESAHSHTKEEQSRECEQGETWGDSPRSHTGRAVQGVWRGRDLRSQPTVTHRKSGPGSVNRESPEESAHSHTQEEQSRECEQGEPGGVSPLRTQVKPGVQQSEVAERRRGQRGSSDPGHRVPWKALGGGLRLLVSMKNGTRHKVLSRAEIQLVWGSKYLDATVLRTNHRREPGTCERPHGDLENDRDRAGPGIHYRDSIHSEGRAGHIMGFSEYPQIKTYRVWIPPTKATMSEYIPWKKTTDSFTNNNNLSTSITAMTFSIINV